MRHARLCPESSAPPGRLGAVECGAGDPTETLRGGGSSERFDAHLCRPSPATSVAFASWEGDQAAGELGGGRIFQSLGLGAGLGSESRASARHEGDPGSIPESGRSPGEGNGNPL